MQLHHILLAITVAALWGFNFIAVKVGLHEMPPFLYCSARFVVACLPLLLLVKNPPEFVKKPPVSWPLIIGIGFSLGVAKFGLMFMGLHLGMSAGLASLVLQSQVFFTAALSVLMLSDTLRMNQILGMLIAFGGITIIGVNLGEQSTLVGFLLILGAAISWAFCNVMIKLAGQVNMFSLVLWTSLIPIIPMYTLSYIFEGPDALPQMLSQMTTLGWACLLFTVCGATWVGSTLWGLLLRTYSATVVVPFALLIPVFGITFGHLFLAEQFNLLTYAACGIVFLGLIINQWRPSIISIRPFEIANRTFFPKKAA
jgi:O-acetylserine/cysteine efflux transporter